MSSDRHMRCYKRFTYEDVIGIVNDSPVLKKLWDNAQISLSVRDEPIWDHEYYYDEVRDCLPKCRVNYYLEDTLLAKIPGGMLGDHDKVYLTLKWLAEFLRQLVKRIGEVWYTENWVLDEYLHKEDLKIVTYDVNDDICFMKYEDEEFRFAIDTFYRFVDGNEQN